MFNRLDHRDIRKNQQCSSTCRLGCLGRPKFDLRVSFAKHLPPSVSTIHTIIQFISVVSSSLQVCLTQFLAAAAGIIAEFHLVSSFQKGEPRSSSYVAFNLSGAAVQPPYSRRSLSGEKSNLRGKVCQATLAVYRDTGFFCRGGCHIVEQSQSSQHQRWLLVCRKNVRWR